MHLASGLLPNSSCISSIFLTAITPPFRIESVQISLSMGYMVGAGSAVFKEFVCLAVYISAAVNSIFNAIKPFVCRQSSFTEFTFHSCHIITPIFVRYFMLTSDYSYRILYL